MELKSSIVNFLKESHIKNIPNPKGIITFKALMILIFNVFI